jgi:hypothetical protein
MTYRCVLEYHHFLDQGRQADHHPKGHCRPHGPVSRTALESLVADMVAQVPLNFPAGPTLWRESYATAPETKTPGTQVEFEDLVKAFWMLLSAANAGRLHDYVVNHRSQS